MKFSPNSPATQVPLLQSTKSQGDISGVGVGVAMSVMVVDSIGTSQKIPVSPVKQSQMTVSFPISMQTPLSEQLMKSHGEIGGVGVGVEVRMTELTGMVVVERVEKGTSKFSELETKNIMDDVDTTSKSEAMVEVGAMKMEVLDSSKTSQNSPVNPTEH